MSREGRHVVLLGAVLASARLVLVGSSIVETVGGDLAYDLVGGGSLPRVVEIDEAGQVMR